MAVEDGEQAAGGVGLKPHPKAKAPQCQWQIILVMRFLALCATAAAILVVTLNKQTKTIVVPLPGNTQLTASITAKFQQTPAFVKGQILWSGGVEQVMVNLQSAGAAAAVAMAELGKNGNSYAGWNKICNTFDAYCDRGTWALVASCIAIALLMAINALSTANFYNNRFY
ncbi:hypothetical protein ACLOJK_021430 [Asimina triloba]